MCRACGYEGPMRLDAVHGARVCPACCALQRSDSYRGGYVVDCPECRQPIGLTLADRGRTVICPHCKYFLGCVLPVEKRKHRPFWARA